MRKFLVGLTAVASLAFSPFPALAAGGQPPVADTDVQVERAGASFRAALSVYVPVSPAVAWEVLTDFDHMANFLPDVTSSEITEHTDSLLKVRQKGVARSGLFSSRFESIREIRLTPQTEIRAHGIGGNIEHMESVMQLHSEGEGTRLTYHAEVTPGFWFPPVIGPSLVRHQTAEQFSAMVQEMQKRQ